MRIDIVLCTLLVACSQVQVNGGESDATVSDATIGVPPDQGSPFDGNSGQMHDGATGQDPQSTPGCVASLDDCFSTELWADCGGEGEVTFACTRHNECRWFAHRCAPTGYHLSACDSDDLCCSENGEPFPVDSEVPGADVFTNTWGILPWPPDRARVLEVVVEPSLADLPPSSGNHGQRFARDYFLLRDGEGTGYVTPAFDIEIDPVSRQARACSTFRDDIVESCTMSQEAVCAVSGVIKVSRIPSANDAHANTIGLIAEVTLADGRVVSVTMPPK